MPPPTKGYLTIKEGISTILVPEDRTVFYNPVQEFNRDLSILVAHGFSQLLFAERGACFSFRILDALTASGFRAIRYAQQIPLATKIIANDLDPQVEEIISRNISNNTIDKGIISVNIQDASAFMYCNKNCFELIDIDPYGSASPFLDAAVQSIATDGLLAITSTDMAVLCGVHPGTCYAKYQGIPLHTDYSKEMAIRLLLNAVEMAANRYGRHIEPLVSCQIDFYIRIFVRIRKSQLEVKKSIQNRVLILGCTACKTPISQPMGTVSEGGKYSFSAIIPRDTTCQGCGNHKLIVNSVLFMTISHMAKVLRASTPPLVDIKSALINSGYLVSISHCDPLGIKTDAPYSFLWDVLKAWVENSKKRPRAESDDTHDGATTVDGKRAIDFTFHPGSVSQSKSQRLVRFHVPPKNWGPLPRARHEIKNKR